MSNKPDRREPGFSRRVAQFDAKVRKNVAQRGWHFTGVFPDESSTVPVFFGYTTGLVSRYGHPDLIIFGVRPEVAPAIIDGIVKEIASGRRFGDGERVGGLVQGNFDLYFRSAPPDDEDYPLSTSKRYYGREDFPVLQVVLPDTQNRMPWEAGCEEKIRLTQQLLVRDAG